MTYLDPPPFPAPVIVQKDVGGLVTDYQARTEQYRREGREVRLHECRSACTLALSLPNVCVYPSSILKFHKAYEGPAKQPNDRVSTEMFEAYPQAIQARLGGLTRDYHALTGIELIALGIRNCNEAPTQEARAKQSPAAVQTATVNENLQRPGLVAFLRSTIGTLTSQGRTPPSPEAAPSPAVTVDPTRASIPAVARATVVPLPPRRPGELAVASVAIPPLPPARPITPAPEPSPPAKPSDLIAGAQTVLPAELVAYVVAGR